MKIGIITVATNKYIRFIPALHASIKKHFTPQHSPTLFVFTNEPYAAPGAIRIEQEHRPFPYPTLMRYHMVAKNAALYRNYDYLFYCDADMLFVDRIDPRVLGKRIATRHPGFYNKVRKDFSYETRPECRAYVPPNMGVHYYCGGFNGGTAAEYITMAETIKTWVDQDAKKNLVAVWHDESHFNRYMIENPPTMILDPSYCMPDSPSKVKAWGLTQFKPKLLALEKNHAEVRS